nr:MAG TPA: hypothetical protein [Caudoviricetes sp.]DAS05078.1 MAG TPA: hypothetical protein [Caudoviricetes sp.]
MGKYCRASVKRRLTHLANAIKAHPSRLRDRHFNHPVEMVAQLAKSLLQFPNLSSRCPHAPSR